MSRVLMRYENRLVNSRQNSDAMDLPISYGCHRNFRFGSNGNPAVRHFYLSEPGCQRAINSIGNGHCRTAGAHDFCSS